MLSGLGANVRTGLIFAILALIFSLFTGIISGVGIGVTLLRSLVMTAVFFVLGYAVIMVMKKYVPEVFEAIDDVQAVSVESKEPSEDDMPDEAVSDDGEYEPSMDGEEGINELSSEDGSLNDELDSAVEGRSSLGRHTIVNEDVQEVLNYEPKVLAQAIRTMLQKDED